MWDADFTFLQDSWSCLSFRILKFSIVFVNAFNEGRIHGYHILCVYGWKYFFPNSGKIPNFRTAESPETILNIPPSKFSCSNLARELIAFRGTLYQMHAAVSSVYCDSGVVCSNFNDQHVA